AAPPAPTQGQCGAFCRRQLRTAGQGRGGARLPAAGGCVDADGAGRSVVGTCTRIYGNGNARSDGRGLATGAVLGGLRRGYDRCFTLNRATAPLALLDIATYDI